MTDCRSTLVSGLEELGLKVSSEQIEKLLRFVNLIEKWNKTYNLTGVKDKLSMIGLHLLDSLAILPNLNGKLVLDVGTGAGLPGIPLAICQPDRHFTLLDSNAKKTRFVQQAVIELKLANVDVVHSRVEQFQFHKPFTTVICRAFAGLNEIVELTRHLLADEGVILAMKGQSAEVDLSGLSANSRIIPVRVPGIEASRCLVRLECIHK